MYRRTQIVLNTGPLDHTHCSQAVVPPNTKTSYIFECDTVWKEGQWVVIGTTTSDMAVRLKHILHNDIAVKSNWRRPAGPRAMISSSVWCDPTHLLLLLFLKLYCVRSNWKKKISSLLAATDAFVFLLERIRQGAVDYAQAGAIRAQDVMTGGRVHDEFMVRGDLVPCHMHRWSFWCWSAFVPEPSQRKACQHC